MISPEKIAGHIQTEMCGGCGNSDPAQRCIGCLHEFTPAPTPVSEQITDAQIVRMIIWADNFGQPALVAALTELQHRRAAEATLRTERDEAREALKPFAALYDESMRDYPDGTAKHERPDDRHAWGFNNANLTWGDLRRARSTLSPEDSHG